MNTVIVDCVLVHFVFVFSSQKQYRRGAHDDDRGME